MDITTLITQYPRGSIIVIALLISFLISLVNFFFLDKEKMREIKAKQKELQAKAKQHQKDGNMDKMMEAQKEMLSHTKDMMKHSFKPMLITIIPMIVFFSFLKNTYETTAVAGSWFWYYLVSAMVGSMIFRKVFKLP